jgi:hypothetical protein
MSFPVLNFHANSVNGTRVSLKWFPSEYLYRHKEDLYCMAIEKFGRSNEILMGGTFMRQNNFIFDVEKNTVGFVRAACNRDPNQIIDEQEMIKIGH